MVSVVLDNVAAGVDRAGILASYPSLQGEDVDAALAYGAELAREETVDGRSAKWAIEVGPRLLEAHDKRTT